MLRIRHFLGVASVSCLFIVGCGDEEQPNPSAKPEEVTQDFAKKSADMMKQANGNMDPKKAAKTLNTETKSAAPAEEPAK